MFNTKFFTSKKTYRTTLSCIGAVAMIFAVTFGARSIFAAPPTGVYGWVLDYSEASIEGATIQLRCGDGEWVNFDSSDEGGDFSSEAAPLGEALNTAGCGDGDTITMRAVADGYVSHSGTEVTTINFSDYAEVITIQAWADQFFATPIYYTFPLAESNTPADGWYGVVQDDDSGNVIEGATLSLQCSGQSGSQLLATTNAEGYFQISQSGFISAMNFLGCYYNSTFDVDITIAANGYENVNQGVYEISSNDMGAQFAEPSELTFYMYVPEIDPATFFNEGDGSEESPFVITTKEQWNVIRDFEDSAEGLYFVLVGDITFDEEYENFGFSGNLDGAGYGIENLSTSLFATIYKGTVKNLSIHNADITYVDQERIGVLARELNEGAYIESVQVSGSIDASGTSCAAVAGLVGYMRDSTIYRSSAAVAVSAPSTNCYHIGGFVGNVQGGSIIRESYASGTVLGGSGVGGFAGIIVGSGTRVSDSYATGAVTGADDEVGGFVGYLGASLLRVHATGSVDTPGSYVGGLVGGASEQASVTNSFTTAQSILGDEEVGGFIGSYADGNVRNSAWVVVPDTYAIGFVYEYTPCALNSSKGLLAGSGACDLGHDFDTVSLLKKDGYDDGLAPVYLDAEDSWDFDTVWKFDPAVNDSLPSLRWGMGDDDIEYVITATANTGGTISPSGEVRVPEGESQTFTITPNNGYTIANVTVDDENMGASSSYTFSNVQSVHTITASFSKKANRVVGGGGGGRSSSTQTTTPVVMVPVVPTPQTPSEKSQCPATQMLTQNLKAGARNGRSNTFAKTTVTEVAILQAHMNRLGFKAGVEDGILGPITDGAIKRMQIYLGTKADGLVGPLTRALINNSCGEAGL
ncbi:peptidoglycan-binding protein [Patescibacteria group bacterium]|nr:peptidoglycan-binding protein [Patescibacteria group bacterium]